MVGWRLYSKILLLPFNYDTKVGKIPDIAKFLMLKNVKKGSLSFADLLPYNNL